MKFRPVRWLHERFESRATFGEGDCPEEIRALSCEQILEHPRFRLSKKNQRRFNGFIRLEEGAYFVKGRRARGLCEQLHPEVGRLASEWRLSHWCHARGVRTLPPLARRWRRRRGLVLSTLLVYEWRDTLRPLGEVVKRPSEDRRALQSAGRELGRQLGKLHRAGAIHRQPHLWNFLVCPRRRRVFVIDLEHAHLTRSKEDHRQNLHMATRALAGASDRVRLLLEKALREGYREIASNSLHR